MPSPWSCLRSWHPVLYLQVTSVPHLKSPPHPKTPQLPPEKWDPKQPHGPSPWKQRMMQRRCAMVDGSQRLASLQPRRLHSKNVISKRKPKREQIFQASKTQRHRRSGTANGARY